MKKIVALLLTAVLCLLLSAALADVYCVNCGVSNPDSANFCYNCGSKLSKPDRPTEPSVGGPGNTPVPIDRPTYLGAGDYYTISNNISLDWYNTDTLGNEYSYSIGQCYYGTGKIEYLVNGKYSTLTGTLFHPYATRGHFNDGDRKQSVSIYGDNRLLYSNSDKIELDPVPFTLNISGVRIISIEISGTYGSSPTLAIGDLAVR